MKFLCSFRHRFAKRVIRRAPGGKGIFAWGLRIIRTCQRCHYVEVSRT